MNIDKHHSNNWNRKAIILKSLKRYEESEKCYNESLRLSPKNIVYDNKARMFYKWAFDLCEKSKEIPNGLVMLKNAKEICTKAINLVQRQNSEENLEKYLKLKDSIDFYINYEEKYQKNLKILKSYPKDELFTIAGGYFYKNKIALTNKMPLKLVKNMIMNLIMMQ